MILRKRIILVATVCMLATGPVLADDIAGADKLICSTMYTFECDPLQEGGCQVRVPEAINMPLFTEIEVDEKVLHTTDAAEVQRATEIPHVQRKDGLLLLQGDQLGRAFSIVINEQSGMMTMSVTSSGEVIIVYGACTTKSAKG